MTELSDLPVFLTAGAAPPEPRPERPDREFERLVNADLRECSAGPAYTVLSRPEHLLRWLQVLTTIRESIKTQNAHDNAVLRAHPDRSGDGQPSADYLETKRVIADRKRSRERPMRAVTERLAEVQRLIGMDPVSGPARGRVVQFVVDIDLELEQGDIEGARAKLAFLMRELGVEPQNETVRDA